MNAMKIKMHLLIQPSMRAATRYDVITCKNIINKKSMWNVKKEKMFSFTPHYVVS